MLNPKTKKFKPRLDKSPSENFSAVPRKVVPYKRKLTDAPKQMTDLGSCAHMASLLDTRLVKNKKIKSAVLDDHQKEFGTDSDNIITTTYLGTSQKIDYLHPNLN